ncbi:MAG: GNAT family N-acetyltransferase [Usitatibacter sp.]
MRWRFSIFHELTLQDVHDLYQARAAVFVVEQKCAFQDVDGADPSCWHLLGFSPTPLGEGQLAAYARLVPPGLKFAEPSIGRVLTAQPARGSGAGRQLMDESIRQAELLWPGQPIRIGAQQYLEKFYGSFGFATISAPYDEDGIQHVEMLRAAGGAQ